MAAHHRTARSALRDGTLEQLLAGHEKVRYKESAGALTEASHPRRTPSKGCDVGLNPFERGNAIVQAIIARQTLLVCCYEVGRAREAEDVGAVVQSDDDERGVGIADPLSGVVKELV